MTLGLESNLNSNEKENLDLEIKEKLNQNLQKLSERLKENFNSKCILSRNPYAPGIGLDNVDDIKNIKSVLDSSLHSDDEYSIPLKELYNNYIKKQSLGEQYKKYHEPYNDTKSNSTTETTILEASFILKDFLKDLEAEI